LRSSGNPDLSKAEIAGIAVGSGVAFALILSILTGFFILYRRRSKPAKPPADDFVPLGGRHELDSKDTRKLVEVDSRPVYELEGKIMLAELLSPVAIEDITSSSGERPP
jgi:hypothetical protein